MEILYVPYHFLSYMWDFGCIPNNHSRPLNKEPPSHPLFSKFSSLPFISQRFQSLYFLKGYRDSPYYPRIFSSLPFYLWEFELSLIKELAIKPHRTLPSFSRIHGSSLSRLPFISKGFTVRVHLSSFSFAQNKCFFPHGQHFHLSGDRSWFGSSTYSALPHLPHHLLRDSSHVQNTCGFHLGQGQTQVVLHQGFPQKVSYNGYTILLV